MNFEVKHLFCYIKFYFSWQNLNIFKILTICENYSNLEKNQQLIILGQVIQSFVYKNTIFAFKYMVCTIYVQ